MQYAYFEDSEKKVSGNAITLENASQLKALSNEKALKIFFMLSRKESYPSEIAKKLKMRQQTAFYYINQLKDAQLIEVSRIEEKQGGMAKLYRANAPAVLLYNKQALSWITSSTGKIGTSKKHSVLEELFSPLIENEEFNAKIITGSHDIHGQFKARARDSHLGIELACFLGSLSHQVRFPVSYLDTMAKNLDEENDNLVIVGGPITNKLAFQLQEHLPIKFEFESGRWSIKSKLSSKTYTEENTGIISFLEHPFFPGKKILFIAGIRNEGTKAAVIALQSSPRKALSANNHNSKINAKVVEGLDLDSDGKIDSFEFRE